MMSYTDTGFKPWKIVNQTESFIHPINYSMSPKKYPNIEEIDEPFNIQF